MTISQDKLHKIIVCDMITLYKKLNRSRRDMIKDFITLSSWVAITEKEDDCPHKIANRKIAKYIMEQLDS